MAGKIVLVTGEDQPKTQARLAAWYAEEPENRRIARTNEDVERALRTGKDAGMYTDPRILETRQKRLASMFANEQEVVDVA